MQRLFAPSSVSRRLAISAAAVWVLGGSIAEARRGPGATLLLLAFAGAVGGAAARGPALRLLLLTAGALVSAASWALRPEVWPWAAAATVSGSLVCRLDRRELGVCSIPLVVPLGLYLVTRGLGLEDAARVLVSGMVASLPPAAETCVRLSAIASAVALASDVPGPESETDPRPAVVSALAVASVLVLLGVRGERLVRAALVPADGMQWSEPPLLMNVLKHRLGVPIYSPPDEVRSFTYAPLLELLQAALLGPFGADLSIVAHRLLVVVWQLLCACLVGLAMARKAEHAERVPFGLAGFFLTLGILAVSPTSWFLHPDHAVHAVLAGAVVLTLGDLPRSRPATVALVLLPPLATAFKMTGAGVGLGLGLVALWARDLRAVRWLALSAALVASVAPVYELVFPGFREYGIELLSRHTVQWHQLSFFLTCHLGRIIVAGVVLAITAPTSVRPPAVRLALLGLGAGALTLLAFLKEGGRENNLVAPALVLGLAAVLSLAAQRAGLPSGRLVSRLAASVLLLLAPLMPPPDPRGLGERDLLLRDHRVAVSFVRRELAAGANPLVYSGTTVWIEAGGKGIPEDGLHPAIELYLGAHPAFERHLDRLAQGRYGSIVAPGAMFTSRGTVGRPLGERLLEALGPRYCLIYPLASEGVPVSLLHSEGIFILRRRDRGCEPLSP